MVQTVRDRIQAAAAACFARQGYGQTTMGAIAREAQVAPATLYRHFPSKEALFGALGRPELRGEGAAPHRRRILDAALDLFSHQGYQASTLTGIAEAAGVARTTLYDQFPTKESILLGVMNENPAMDWLAGAGERSAASDPVADLTTLAQRIIEQEQDPRRVALVRLLVAEGVRFPTLQEHYHQGEAMVYDRMAGYLLSLVPGLPDPHFAARVFLSALLSFVRQNIIPGSTLPQYPPEELARKLATALLHGLIP